MNPELKSAENFAPGSLEVPYTNLYLIHTAHKLTCTTTQIVHRFVDIGKYM